MYLIKPRYSYQRPSLWESPYPRVVFVQLLDVAAAHPHRAPSSRIVRVPWRTRFSSWSSCGPRGSGTPENTQTSHGQQLQRTCSYAVDSQEWVLCVCLVCASDCVSRCMSGECELCVANTVCCVQCALLLWHAEVLVCVHCVGVTGDLYHHITCTTTTI